MRTIKKLIRLAYEAIEILRFLKANTKEDMSYVFQKTYLTEEEAAFYLSCKKSYIKALMRSGMIGYYTPTANNSYISRVDLDRFIISGDRVLSRNEHTRK